MSAELDEEHRARIRAWVAALRSGQFVQHYGSLRGPDNYRCCLGVACDVSGVGKWVGIGRVDEVDFPEQYEPTDASAETYTLPWQVAVWLFGGDLTELLSDDSGSGISPEVQVDNSERRVSLANLNDTGEGSGNNEPYTFDQIAAAIEREWLT